MIWQFPEMWEILGTMNIVGLSVCVSGFLHFALMIFWTQSFSYARENEEPITTETQQMLSYVAGCCKRSGLITQYGLFSYSFCIFLLSVYANELAGMQ